MHRPTQQRVCPQLIRLPEPDLLRQERPTRCRAAILRVRAVAVSLRRTAYAFRDQACYLRLRCCGVGA